MQYFYAFASFVVNFVVGKTYRHFAFMQLND